MRILLTTDTIGGVWTFTKSLVAELLAQGHDAALISFGRFPSASQKAWCATTKAEYDTRFEYLASDIPLEWMTDSARSYSCGLSLIRRLVDHFTPDIIHSNQFCYGYIPIPIPVVITAHSDVISWAAACRPEVLTQSPWLTQYKSLVEQGLENAAAVVAPTRWMLEALKQNFTFSASEHVILNGRSLTTFSPSRLRKLQAVSVGRLWDKAKNLALLAATKSPMPILVGGEQSYENLMTSLNFDDLTLLGHLDESELFALFTDSSVYIIPSLYEPFGLAPLEAALCGCAIVAHDIASLREVWGNAALYFTDSATLSHLLDQLCKSSEYLAQAQCRAMDRARQLSAEQMANQYLRLYKILLNSPVTIALPESRTHVC